MKLLAAGDIFWLIPLQTIRGLATFIANADGAANTVPKASNPKFTIKRFMIRDNNATVVK
jgi:hypothetical protein